MQLRIINQAQGIYTSVSVIGSPVRFWVFSRFLFLFWSHDAARRCVKVRLDVRRAIFLDHLDAGAAVLRDLADIGPFHQAQTDVCVPQAIGLRELVRSPCHFRPEVEI